MATFNKKTHKRCIKCREIQPRERFGNHETSNDGKQSYCKTCKNALGKRRHERNVSARLRHHISTRVSAQLGNFAPRGVTSDLEVHLGYRVRDLAKSLALRLESDYPGERLRNVLNAGWHVDHIIPLSSYRVIRNGEVDWDLFRECWAIDNLRAVPADVNLQKGAKIG